MYKGKKVVVVLPAYNALRTLEKTYREIPLDWVDQVILCDDASQDGTVVLAKKLGIEELILHEHNRGYGGNQKSLYQRALALDADIVIMLHPDYQYTPKLLIPMIHLLGEGLFDVVLGSRILGKGALEGGMPLYKYIANRFLTLVQNLLSGHKLSEYHTGYRAFTKEVLLRIPFNRNSEDFLFDNQMLAQAIYGGFNIGEITCPTLYFADASSINFKRSLIYGLGVLKVACMHFLHRKGIFRFSLFDFSK
ncbi:MAG: glycosyltransferase family 2 protein [Bacteroidetes bacterium]|nr:glycosyltransferase family 2 protein [Bacteroidota bacterium]